MVSVLYHTEEVRVIIAWCINKVLKSSVVLGTARKPVTDGVFVVRDTALPVNEAMRVWLHRKGGDYPVPDQEDYAVVADCVVISRDIPN